MKEDIIEGDAQRTDAEFLAAGAVPKMQVPAHALPALPNAPTAVVVVKKTPEELELEALQKEMGLLEPA